MLFSSAWCVCENFASPLCLLAMGWSCFFTFTWWIVKNSIFSPPCFCGYELFMFYTLVWWAVKDSISSLLCLYGYGLFTLYTSVWRAIGNSISSFFRLCGYGLFMFFSSVWWVCNDFSSHLCCWGHALFMLFLQYDGLSRIQFPLLFAFAAMSYSSFISQHDRLSSIQFPLIYAITTMCYSLLYLGMMGCQEFNFFSPLPLRLWVVHALYLNGLSRIWYPLSFAFVAIDCSCFIPQHESRIWFPFLFGFATMNF